MRKLKKYILVPVFILLLCALAACGEAQAEPDLTPGEMMAQMVKSQELGELTYISENDEEFYEYLAAYYQIDESDVEAGTICYASGAAHELAVLKMKDEQAAESAGQALESYRDRRVGDFAGYMPEQAEIVENALTVVEGRYAALIICKEQQQAKDAFLSCFAEGFVPKEAQQPDEDTEHSEDGDAPAEDEVAPGDEYDGDAVRNAFKAGSGAELSEKNRAVYKACAKTINDIINEDMSDYEKELAIHDWIIDWAEYDIEATDRLAQEETDNLSPYGLIINKKAVCSGYSSTFQLFMDLLGIECITVEGTSNHGTEAHAWNMVKLENEWYCVDVTWDDPFGQEQNDSSVWHRYFNVTSRYMSRSDHQWDEKAVPEAKGTKFSWGGER